MIDEKAIAELQKPLDPKNVKPPPQGKYGEYVDSYHVLSEANRIFDYAWCYEITSLEQCSRVEATDGRGNPQIRIAYRCTVRVSINSVFREGAAVGTGMAKPENEGDAHESAVKEAETDALKRGLRSLGNTFGLALYDKTKANVQAPPQDLPTGPINDATRDWIASKIEGRQIPVGELCKAFEVTSLKALTYEQIEDVKNWIRDYQKEAA